MPAPRLALAGGLSARRASLLTGWSARAAVVRAGRTSGPALAARGVEVLGQRKLFQRSLPGLMHALIFWGFLVLLTTIAEASARRSTPDFELPRDRPCRVARAVQDVFAAGVLIGIGIAVSIRLLQRPERFVGSHRVEAYRILGLIFWIIATLFAARGARIAVG